MSSLDSRIRPGKVHLWRIGFRPDGSDFQQVLSLEERQRASRYRFEEHRRKFVQARAVLRHLLAAYTESSAAGLHFRYGKNGKPGLDGGVHFNVSYGGEFAFVAISLSQLGLDVEYIDTQFKWQAVAQQFFSPRELKWIASLPPQLQAHGFFFCWTRHEAYGKAVGTGLATNINIRLEAIRRVHEASGIDWTLGSLMPCADYIGAIAIKAERITLQFYDWSTVLRNRCCNCIGDNLLPECNLLSTVRDHFEGNAKLAYVAKVLAGPDSKPASTVFQEFQLEPE